MGILGIEIYTPKEMASLMSAAGPVMVPFLAMSGFAGLRSKEVERLDWAEVQLERGVHRVEALEEQDRPTSVGTDPAESGSVAGAVRAKERSSMGARYFPSFPSETASGGGGRD